MFAEAALLFCCSLLVAGLVYCCKHAGAGNAHVD